MARSSTGSNWNMVFVGVPNAPAGNFPTPGQRYTKVPETPVVREKRFGVINRVVADTELLAEAHTFATKFVHGPTRAHAAHKALLRAWANGGVQAADDVMFDVAMPLFETEDVKDGLASAVEALKDGPNRSRRLVHQFDLERKALACR